MAKKEKSVLHLNRVVIDEFKKKFHHNLSMNFFSNKKVIISKSCFTPNLAYRLGELNGLVVNTWAEEKATFDVLIVSETDCEEIIKGNIFEDVLEAMTIVNRRQTIVDSNKVSANVFIIHEKDFIDYYANRTAYIEQHKCENFDEAELFRLFKLTAIDVRGNY